MKRVRFWHYNNGAVRLTIGAGETLRHTSGGPTDEGYSFESNEWEFDGETLFCHWYSDGRDCDGRLSREGISYCEASGISEGYIDEDGIHFPAWKNGMLHQRDYSAEAMGY